MSLESILYFICNIEIVIIVYIAQLLAVKGIIILLGRHK